VREFFDHQAATFERRAGLPEEYCREIALAVLKMGDAGAQDLLVELGAGTGQIGRWFTERVRYVGLDLSRAMLREFRAHSGGDARAGMLVRADAQVGWPIADGSARIVFASRAVHLLDEEHVARELSRVGASQGAVLIIGRVRRERESMRAGMAREMNKRLLSRGYEGRGGEKQNRKLFEACRRLGAEILGPRTVARWKVSTSPRRSLDSWRSLVSLGGVCVPAPAREEILDELEDWAGQEFGSLDREFQEEESYVLYGVALSFR